MDRTTAPYSISGFYQDADPQSGIPRGTTLMAVDRNAVQEEILSAIQDAGLTPDAADLTQLTQAIRIGFPVGSLLIYTGSTPPPGWLEMDGSALSRTSYDGLWAHAQASGMFDGTGVDTGMFGSGDGSTTFDLPDLRGEFLRGWDNGRGADVGRLLGAAQIATGVYTRLGTGIPQGINQSVIGIFDGEDPFTEAATATAWSEAPGALTASNEDANTIFRFKPRNIALMFCIKY
ncbi:MAG: phage tail protein [Pseudomonadota bacterium]